MSAPVSRPVGMVFETPLAELGFRLARYAEDARDHATQPTALTHQNLETASLFLAYAVQWLLQVSPATAQTALALRIPLPTRQIPSPGDDPMSHTTPTSHPSTPSISNSLFVTTASETQCSALVRYGVDARRQTPPHQMSAILSVGGIPVHGVTADVLLGLQIECVTDRGGSRELLISDAFTTDDLEALIAVLTAVRDRAHREGLLASDPGVPACVREDA